MRSTVRLGCAGASLLLLCIVAPVPGGAQPFAREGLVFSDELGGFTIRALSGSGTTDDPFVLVEDVTGSSGAILVVRGLSPAFGNRIATQHVAGFALTKIVTNRTAQVWRSYNLELREVLTAHSPYEDGLSFAQGATEGRPFRSSGFTHVAETDEPFDSVDFSDGTIPPGQSVSFSILITDTTPTSLFYLTQQQVEQVAGQPGSPNTLAAAAMRRYPRRPAPVPTQEPPG